MKKTAWKYALLLSGISMLGSAMAMNPASDVKPKPEDFPSYSQFLQALIDYQRQQGNHGFSSAPVASVADSNSSESLDDAVAKASAGSNPGYVDTSSHPRSTYRTFALNQLASYDMSATTINDALGTYDEHQMEEEPGTTARLRADNDLSLTPDVALRLIGDAYDGRLLSLGDQANTMSGDIILPEGQGRVSATTRKNADGSLDLNLTSSVRTNVYFIDRDGIPNSGYAHAGAVALRSLALDIRDVNANISGARSGNSNGNDLLVVKTTSPNAIRIDLSGTRIGVADATYDGSIVRLSSANIGQVNYFMRFGNNSVLTIAPGMNMKTVITHPDGLNKPLVTINGDIGDINISDVALTDFSTDQNGGSNILSIGKVGLSNLSMRNMHIYIVNRSIVMDVGNGINDLGMSLERVSVGSDPSIMVGDLYIQHMNVSSSRIQIASH